MHPLAPRLTFRDMTPGDLDNMAALLGDPDVMTYYPRPKTRPEAARWIDWNHGLYRTRGYATEAAAASRDFARTVLGAKRLIAIIHPDNRPSQRVAEKIGLLPEKRATVHGGREAIIYAAALEEAPTDQGLPATPVPFRQPEIMAGMRQDRAVDGFRLTYDRTGHGPAVLLLHGWPGDRTDYRAVAPLVSAEAEVIVPDLRGFGESDKHEADPATQYNAVAQARSVLGLIEELELRRPVIAGYDVGSRVAQAIARERPDLIRALVIAPPLPGIGDRILDPQAQREFWYQSFHQLDLCPELIDGKPDAVRTYLRHFWSHWSGPGYEPASDDLDHLVSVYGPPGAFTASIAWYRSGAGAVAASLAEQVPEPDRRTAVPTTVLWPSHDPLFPRTWSDRIEEFFADATLTLLDGVGHFSPLECPGTFATAVTAAASAVPS